uniref:Nuclear pore complex protein n=1 Tax=Ciona savignyi TaxID=51511 RepID=H2YVY0_CIOSA
MSGIVHSPATTRDGRARMRRAGDAMKLIDDALTGDSMISAIASTSRNFDLERTLPPTRTTRFNTTRSTRKVDDSLFAEPVDMTMMLNETGYLFEPTTPHRYKSRIDDPTSVESASMGLFSDFKNSLSRYGSTVDLFHLVDSYVEVCEDNEGLVRSLTTSMRKGPGYEMAEDMEKLLKHEKQTWRLINALYKDRQSSASNEELMNVDDMMKQISEKQAVEKYFEADCDVRHAQIVIDWLEQNAADEIEGVFEKLQSYSSNVSWENTLHRLKKNKDQGIEDRHLISEMDPDAPSRQKRAIDELDRQDENQLLKIVFSFIRSGKIEEAEDFCVTHGQPWRAATLEGWRLHNDPNMEETG